MSPTRKTTIYVSSADQLPEVEHYAIIESSSHDDSYGGSSSHVEYKAFLDRAEWESEIARMTQSKYQRSFRAMHVRPANVKISVEVKVQ